MHYCRSVCLHGSTSIIYVYMYVHVHVGMMGWPSYFVGLLCVKDFHTLIDVVGWSAYVG